MGPWQVKFYATYGREVIDNSNKNSWFCYANSGLNNSEKFSKLCFLTEKRKNFRFLPKNHPNLKPCIRAAMTNAAPQIPAGRRPIAIQSRFIRETIRFAVSVTSFDRFENPVVHFTIVET